MSRKKQKRHERQLLQALHKRNQIIATQNRLIDSLENLNKHNQGQITMLQEVVNCKEQIINVSKMNIETLKEINDLLRKKKIEY